MATLPAIDDEPAAENLITRLLTRDGNQVVDRLMDKPSTIVLDPICQSWMDCSHQAYQASASAIVVVLASGSADLLAAGVSAGAGGYMAKPFSAESLICRVMGIFERTGTP